MPKTTGVDDDRNGHSRPPLMDIEAVAQRLAVGVRHVRRLVTEKRIPYRKWGHLLRFEPDEIEAWIEASRVAAEPATPPRMNGRRVDARGGLCRPPHSMGN
jgi:excisionase family DNA binding protein